MSRPVARKLAALALALLGAAGCSGGQVRPAGGDAPSVAADGALTIVGWSQRDQGPLGVVGVLRGEGGREVGAFDTRVDPARGKTFDQLAAGHYRIEITQRIAGGRAVAAAAAEELDVQPGQKVRREVVVDDRDASGGQNGAEH